MNSSIKTLVKIFDETESFTLKEANAFIGDVKKFSYDKGLVLAWSRTATLDKQLERIRNNLLYLQHHENNKRYLPKFQTVDFEIGQATKSLTSVLGLYSKIPATATYKVAELTPLIFKIARALYKTSRPYVGNRFLNMVAISSRDMTKDVAGYRLKTIMLDYIAYLSADIKVYEERAIIAAAWDKSDLGVKRRVARDGLLEEIAGTIKCRQHAVALADKAYDFSRGCYAAINKIPVENTNMRKKEDVSRLRGELTSQVIASFERWRIKEIAGMPTTQWHSRHTRVALAEYQRLLKVEFDNSVA